MYTAINFIMIAALLFTIYCYIIYPLLLKIIRKKRNIKTVKNQIEKKDLPTLTVVITAYNEEKFISRKLLNTVKLLYPKKKLKIIVVTDGSTDKTTSIASSFQQITMSRNFKVLHKNERKGKLHALNRIISEIDTDIAAFTDANTFLNRDALLELVNALSDKKVACATGRKKLVERADFHIKSEAGYWDYESKIKKMESDLCSVVGAIGEIYAIKTKQLMKLPQDTIIEDFVISLLLYKKGYKTAYCHNVIASEEGSLNFKEELKRKSRISAGGFQAVLRYKELLNPFKYGFFSFQFFSHRLLRWLVCPLCILYIFFYFTTISLYVFININSYLQFAILAATVIISQKEMLRKLLFSYPCQLLLIQYSIFAGVIKGIFNRQSVVWEKAERFSI